MAEPGQTVAELRFNSTVGSRAPVRCPSARTPRRAESPSPRPRRPPSRTSPGPVTSSGDDQQQHLHRRHPPRRRDVHSRPRDASARDRRGVPRGLTIRDARGQAPRHRLGRRPSAPQTPDGAYTALRHAASLHGHARAQHAPARGRLPRRPGRAASTASPSTGDLHRRPQHHRRRRRRPTATSRPTRPASAPPTASVDELQPSGWTGRQPRDRAHGHRSRERQGPTPHQRRSTPTSSSTSSATTAIRGRDLAPRSVYGSFHPIEPFRLYDSRQDVKVSGYEIFDLVADFGAINPNIKALALNVTGVSPEGARDTSRVERRERHRRPHRRPSSTSRPGGSSPT